MIFDFPAPSSSFFSSSWAARLVFALDGVVADGGMAARLSVVGCDASSRRLDGEGELDGETLLSALGATLFE